MKLAGEVQSGDRVADIGTDHGLLPIFLCENRIASHVILCDINSGPLEKARENIARFGADLSDLRQGDGLSCISPGEADTIIIAGMGGILIAGILCAGSDTARSAKRLVLQPRSKPEILRRFLRENGYFIIRESLVLERGDICQIITAVPQNNANNKNVSREPDKTLWQSEFSAPFASFVLPAWNGKSCAKQLLEDEVSPLLFQNRDPLLIPFLERKIRIEETIIGQIIRGCADDETNKDGKIDEERENDKNERLAQAEERLSTLRKLLRKAREEQ